VLFVPLWLAFLNCFCRGLRGRGGAVAAVGGAVTAVLGLFLGHVDALFGFAVELRVRAVIEAVFSIDPDFDRRNAARWLRCRLLLLHERG